MSYYQVLGLTPACTASEIKKSYRQLALVWHPDKHSDKAQAQINFSLINQAYNVLIDTTKRNIYDNCGEKGLELHRDGQDDNNLASKNHFIQKGFCGTDKSAFDILQDILQDNNDDFFFKGTGLSEMVGSFNSTLKSFFDENLMSHEEEQSDLFANFKPSFLDANHQLPSFEQFFMQNTSSTQLFSSIFGNESSDLFNTENPRSRSRKNSLTIRTSEQTALHEEAEEKFEEHCTLKHFLNEKIGRKRSFLIKDGDETSESEGMYRGSKHSSFLNRTYLMDEPSSEETEYEARLNFNSKKIQKASRNSKQGSLLKTNKKNLKNRG